VVALVFVLSGGGAIGAYQAGALLALAEADLVPDAVVSCSAGALNGAFYAADPTTARARALVNFWQAPDSRAVLAPSLLSRARGLPNLLRHGDALLDQRPLRSMLARYLDAHDLRELAVPLTVTTTCLDCGTAVHHRQGPLTATLLASCALPGLLPPVRLADGHMHVDGGVVCGVPLQAALDTARPTDTVLVLDAGSAPVTGPPDSCAAEGADGACGLPRTRERRYLPPVERSRTPLLDVVLRAFTVARGAANRAAVQVALADPRVRVLPHVADAWAAGFLDILPTGPRDFDRTGDLVAAGHTATHAWLRAGSGRLCLGEPGQPSDRLGEDLALRLDAVRLGVREDRLDLDERGLVDSRQLPGEVDVRDLAGDRDPATGSVGAELLRHREVGVAHLPRGVRSGTDRADGLVADPPARERSGIEEQLPHLLHGGVGTSGHGETWHPALLNRKTS
jgi:predicted acylesterase/phospholipase RssA